MITSSVFVVVVVYFDLVLAGFGLFFEYKAYLFSVIFLHRLRLKGSVGVDFPSSKGVWSKILREEWDFSSSIDRKRIENFLYPLFVKKNVIPLAIYLMKENLTPLAICLMKENFTHFVDFDINSKFASFYILNNNSTRSTI